ncbi:hypothetical protein BKA57DRAFT_505905 [Linnemannia elongata]|uniref:DUF1748-domain-containing protein n=2 Tax=Linnemannia TaxID=2779861 RepID=A0ABQ7JT05_9FUNG|nr:hypothetical protein BGZ88_011006 [Linnemannia elongata]KAG0284592.1 hypothetical protein BGZ96_011051 [Linnemannia gamsii]OAQ29838.1 DUF1748-domain-containing protein [Linnemannia elongata AG-77]KAG0070720.1 hypothetical protein BGZ89_012634 [Linnemannia elongata]KAH7046897.1 hypothetical protein BKA57DRAFT_505905 [Linnemannia elongata]
MIGKLAHYAADAVLVSAVIAGIKRSTGLSVATEKIESSDVRGYVEKYLSVGEVVIDQTAAFMSTSSYFERKR